MYNLEEKMISRKDVFKGDVLNVHIDVVSLPNGKTSTREVINHPGAACIVPLTKEEDVLFVRQYRYPFSKVMLELPAGKLEPGQEPLDNAIRELKEETGAVAENYIHLGSICVSPGYCDETIHIYCCKISDIGAQKLDEDEFLNIEKISLNKAFKMVMYNEIDDAKTQIAILKTYYMKQCGSL